MTWDKTGNPQGYENKAMFSAESCSHYTNAIIRNTKNPLSSFNSLSLSLVLSKVYNSLNSSLSY